MFLNTKLRQTVYHGPVSALCYYSDIFLSIIFLIILPPTRVDFASGSCSSKSFFMSAHISEADSILSSGLFFSLFSITHTPYIFIIFFAEWLILSVEKIAIFF